ncbi:PREDICTED: 1-phosphatidylinositol 4,5-bisphosphate phosphodiesterase delta-4-like isoform X2 [Priapulus caudatus]|uniref:Phosphoinositide phospholipase C n=1 Tax=Priapulus caudatus TaxID=37621 RepID=A0ABM1EW66_PRICU|nr:PREDICTED: 1-phosphatidylinositol 4,5-bisphosphate phosphodiesterase delta-4-like isoform X2 [Priapulus caudatus]
MSDRGQKKHCRRMESITYLVNDIFIAAGSAVWRTMSLCGLGRKSQADKEYVGPYGQNRLFGVQDNLKEDVAHLTKGLHMVKVRGAGKQYSRHFELTPDLMGIRQCDSKKWIKRGNSYFDLAEIKEIRSGWNTDVFQAAQKRASYHEPLEEAHCFSLVLGEKHDTLDLIADSEEDRSCWLTVLNTLVKRQKYSALRRRHFKWVKNHFLASDANRDGVLNFEEVMNVLGQMNINMDRHHAKNIFNKADVKKQKNKKEEDALDPEEFVRFYTLLRHRPEIDKIFQEFTKDDDDDFMDPEELQEFLKKAQKADVSVDECRAMIQKYEPLQENKEVDVLSGEGLRQLLLGAEQDIFNLRCNQIYQDMTRPITHYFIDSSHNTYLMEDQLRGPSSIEAYKRALQKGCRCVEMDLWDGNNGEPIIFHGHTLTSKILFKDALTACMEYAFKTSDYPVILSMENHCSVEQQKMVASHLKDILGSTLWYIDLDDTVTEMPSPEKLRGKIVVKGKRLPPPYPDPNVVDEDEVSDEDEAAEIVDEIITKELTKKVGKTGKKVKLAKELSDRVLLKSVHFSNFELAKAKCKCYEMSSFVEKKAEKLISTEPASYVEHNKLFLSRIYPNGLRTDSSNYSPIDMWNVGCQIVALNYQTAGKQMQLYKGKFQDNGKCGYLLKPAALQDARSTFNPNKPETYGCKPKLLTIKIISGQRLPKPGGSMKGEVIDPYVVVSVHGVPPDNQKVKTKIIMDNGFNPLWDETFKLKIQMPELALVRFTVYDYDVRSKNDFVGTYTLPFTCMQEGYCHFRITDKHGDPHIVATLFVHVSIETDS